MFSEIYGYRVNLVYVAVVVAFYDLIHILHELKERFLRFQEYESTDYGCMSDMFQSHCLATYSEIGVYAIDFIFTCFLIYGASSVKFSLTIRNCISSNFNLSSKHFQSCVGFFCQRITWLISFYGLHLFTELHLH